MKRYTLSNGLKLVVDERKADTVSIMASVQIGSLYERGNEGISHLLEHMVLEGTKKRKTAKEIASEIEKVGGIINAYTHQERTCYYIKVQKKYFSLAVDILSDVIQNAIIDEKTLEKERGVILKEINMSLDEPRIKQWISFYGALFPNSSAGNPIFGSVKSLKSITRKDLWDFYKKHYVPENIVVGVVGDIKNAKSLISRKFSFPSGKYKINKITDPNSKSITKIEKVKTLNSYFVLGFKTARRNHPDSYVLDVIKAILGRGQSGILFNEVRNKRGLVYEIGAYQESDKSFGVFLIYLNTEKKNVDLCKKIILKELALLKKVPKKEIDEAIGYIEGSTILLHENTEKRVDDVCFWETVGDARGINSYVNKIKRVTRADILRVVKKYFTKPTILILER
ncbi:M16 family metallopeptidase [Nanoarchaeota archaeon]